MKIEKTGSIVVISSSSPNPIGVGPEDQSTGSNSIKFQSVAICSLPGR